VGRPVGLVAEGILEGELFAHCVVDRLGGLLVPAGGRLLVQKASPLELVEVAERALLAEWRADRRPGGIFPDNRSRTIVASGVSACYCVGVISACLTTTLLSRSPSMRR
jgi:hypothetical protein